MKLTTCTGWLIVLCLVMSRGSFAQTQETIAKAPITKEAARKLRERASAMKGEAERQFGRDMAECNKKTFPNSCFDSAKERKRDLLTESHQLDQKGREGEREARRLERAVKETQRTADAPRLEAEENARIEKQHQENARREAERETRSVKDANDLAQRRSKTQAEDAARRKKREEQARRDAERERVKPLRLREEQERQKAIAEHAALIDQRLRKDAEEQKGREADAAAKLAAKRNPEKKGGFLCELWPGRFCTEAGTGR